MTPKEMGDLHGILSKSFLESYWNDEENFAFERSRDKFLEKMIQLGGELGDNDDLLPDERHALLSKGWAGKQNQRHRRPPRRVPRRNHEENPHPGTAMTIEEQKRLKEIVKNKYHELFTAGVWNDPDREESWRLLCENLGIRRLSKLVHLCAPPELDEVRVEEPTGGFLCMGRETARKILVLGL